MGHLIESPAARDPKQIRDLPILVVGCLDRYMQVTPRPIEIQRLHQPAGRAEGNLNVFFRSMCYAAVCVAARHVAGGQVL